jgi:hypothetical protein
MKNSIHRLNEAKFFTIIRKQDIAHINIKDNNNLEYIVYMKFEDLNDYNKIKEGMKISQYQITDIGEQWIWCFIDNDNLSDLNLYYND